MRERKVMQCPNCKATLRTIEYEGIRIDTCDGCAGEWLDGAELGHIVNAREARFDEQERQAIAAAAKITGVALARADRDLECPRCAVRTDAINYAGDSGITIDRCPRCRGFWLDAEELETVQMLVEGWEDLLPEDLAKHGPRLRQIATEVESRLDVNVSRFAFVNAIINGIIAIMYD